MKTNRCPECGTETFDSADVCIDCGHPMDGGDRLSPKNISLEIDRYSGDEYKIVSVDYDVNGTTLTIEATVEKSYQDEGEDLADIELELVVFDPFDNDIATDSVTVDAESNDEEYSFYISVDICQRGIYRLRLFVD